MSLLVIDFSIRVCVANTSVAGNNLGFIKGAIKATATATVTARQSEPQHTDNLASAENCGRLVQQDIVAFKTARIAYHLNKLLMI